MRRNAVALLLGMLVVLAVPAQSWAGGRHWHRGHHHRHHGHPGHHHGGHFYFGLGAPVYHYGWAPYWGYPPTRTVIVEEPEPPVYIERSAGDWWYFCESAGEYYPSVPTCPEPWVQVAPRAE